MDRQVVRGVALLTTLVTLVSLMLAGGALYAYQRTIGLGRPAALAGALLFAVSGGAIQQP